jgi:hypothetical protein
LLFGQGKLQEAIPLLERHKATLTDLEKQAIGELAAHYQAQVIPQVANAIPPNKEEGTVEMEHTKAPKVVGLAMVKNEQDVIEPFIRHNIRFLDRLIVLDNGSVDDTRQILASLEQEFDNLTIIDDQQFGLTHSEHMTRLLHRCQASFAADYVVSLDADEFLDMPDRSSFHAMVAQIPSGGYGLIPWCTFVLTPDSVSKVADDPLRSIEWRRRHELPLFWKAILRLDGGLATDIVIEQGNHNARSTLGRALPVVALDSLRLLHYPVRSQDQFLSKTVVGWMAYLAKDVHAVERGQGAHCYANFKLIANGQSIDLKKLCDLSMSFAQSPRAIDWNVDVVHETTHLVYERRYSSGKFLGALEMIARSWEQSLTGPGRHAAPGLDAGAIGTTERVATSQQMKLAIEAPKIEHLVEQLFKMNSLELALHP